MDLADITIAIRAIATIVRAIADIVLGVVRLVAARPAPRARTHWRCGEMREMPPRPRHPARVHRRSGMATERIGIGALALAFTAAATAPLWIEPAVRGLVYLLW